MHKEPMGQFYFNGNCLNIRDRRGICKLDMLGVQFCVMSLLVRQNQHHLEKILNPRLKMWI